MNRTGRMMACLAELGYPPGLVKVTPEGRSVIEGFNPAEGITIPAYLAWKVLVTVDGPFAPCWPCYSQGPTCEHTPLTVAQMTEPPTQAREARLYGSDGCHAGFDVFARTMYHRPEVCEHSHA